MFLFSQVARVVLVVSFINLSSAMGQSPPASLAEYNAYQAELRETNSVYAQFAGEGPEEKVQIPIILRNNVSENKIRDLQSPHYDASNDAGLILVFRAPTNFSLRDCGENAASLSETDASSMINSNFLANPSNQSRFTQVKGIGQTRELKLEKGDCKSSISIGIRAFQLIGGPGSDLIAYAVSDKVIEAYHSYKGYNDPYGRKEMGYDVANAELVDLKGNAFEPNAGQYYMLPIRIKYDQYKTIFEHANSKLRLDMGVQAQIPVSRPFDQAAVGVHSNLVYTQRITDNWAATAGAGLGVNIQSTVFGGYQPSDQRVNLVTDAHIAGAITRYDRNQKGMTSFIVDVGAQTPLLKASSYTEVDRHADYLQALGQQASISNEYGITVGITRTWGDQINPTKNSLTLHCKEDYKNPAWKYNGNNNEDFRCGVQYTRKFN